jgi:Flp pilus assembly protein TadG
MRHPHPRRISPRFRGALSRLWSDRSGNLVTYFAIGLIPLIMAAGVAVDYSDLLRQKHHMQNLLDGAVLAGAGSDEDPIKTAKAFFSGSLPENLSKSGSTGVQAAFDIQGKS